MLGPSGSGKTTTLRMIAGFELPTAGRILLHGADVTAIPPFDRDVNTVFQDYALFPHMTVGDNVAYGLVVRKVAKADRRLARDRGAPDGPARRATRSASRASCRAASGSGSRSPGRSSTGRACCSSTSRSARSTSSSARRCRSSSRRSSRQVGITFIYVTHDQEEALTMSDRLAVFNQGRIEQIGAPAEVYERPLTRFVAGFVGTSNLLRGEAARADPGHGRHVHDPAREDPAGRPRRDGRSRRDVGDRGRPGRRLPRPRHPLRRRPRRGRGARRHPAELVDVLDRGARPGRQGCPAHLEAAASTPRRGWGVNVEEETECVSEA